MKNQELWRQPIDLTPIDAINHATQYDMMYTPGYDSHAQAVILRWISDREPDAEDLFTFLDSLQRTRRQSGFSRWNLSDAVNHKPDLQADNHAYSLLQTAHRTYFQQNMDGVRTYGDGVVFTKSDITNPEGLNKYHRCQSLAYSNGCPDIDAYIAKVAARSSQPSSREHSLDVASSDYFRSNLLWLHFMGLVQQSGNTKLLREILHGREELPDNAGDTNWMPKKVNGKREVRFLARSGPFFGITKPIWKRYDALCAAGSYELASQTFDDDVTLLETIIGESETISAVAERFQTLSCARLR